MRIAQRSFVVLLALAAAAACRTTSRDGPAGVKADEGDGGVLLELKAAMKAGGCNGCHSGMDLPDFVPWATDTRATYDVLQEREKAPGFNPAAIAAKGAYRAYPEYFRAYFASSAEYDAFAAALRPDPAMAVKGAGDADKRAKFEALRDALLKLAAQASNAP